MKFSFTIIETLEKKVEVEASDYNEAKNDDERVAIQRVLSSIQKDLSASQIAVNNENVRQIQAQTRIAVTENLLREQELKFLPQAQKLQLAQGAADIALKYAQKDLTEKQAQHEIKKLSETAARTSLTNQQYWTCLLYTSPSPRD